MIPRRCDDAIAPAVFANAVRERAAIAAVVGVVSTLSTLATSLFGTDC
jgi:hypothetical protein